MIRCFVGLGSNLNDPQRQLQQALRALGSVPQTRRLRCSPWYWNPSLSVGQPDYLNGAVELGTALPPTALLDALQSIEADQGRERREHWGARTLDLDLLLYGDDVIASERLRVPHPGLTQRIFVLRPLLDIDSELQLPDGSTVASHLDYRAERTLRPMLGSPLL